MDIVGGVVIDRGIRSWHKAVFELCADQPDHAHHHGKPVHFAIYQYYVSGVEQTLTNNAEAAASMFNRYAPSGDIEDKQDFTF